MKSFYLSPLIGVRNSAPPEQRVTSQPKWEGKGYKADAKHKPAKYDHHQMLMDRIDGMTWSRIAEKHGVMGKDGRANASIAYRLAINSRALHKLTPAQVSKL